MIFKILSRCSPGYGSLINYILKEGKGANDKKPEPYLHNFRGSTVNQWIRELYINEAFRKQERKGQVYFYHAILSFNSLDSDKISKEMLTDITAKFIELRGREGMYLSAIHQDTGHTHIHCLISALEYRKGKAFRMTKGEMQELKIQLQEYQKEKYPLLENSLPNHGACKEYLSQKEYGVKTKNSKAYIKAELSQKVNDAFKQANNQKHFLELLQESGLHHYERGGKAYGITLDDKNYRFSSLGVDMKKFNALGKDLSEEERTLEEIKEIRQKINLEFNGREINY